MSKSKRGGCRSRRTNEDEQTSSLETEGVMMMMSERAMELWSYGAIELWSYGLQAAALGYRYSRDTDTDTESWTAMDRQRAAPSD